MNSLVNTILGFGVVTEGCSKGGKVGEGCCKIVLTIVLLSVELQFQLQRFSFKLRSTGTKTKISLTCTNTLSCCILSSNNPASTENHTM